MKRSSSPPRLTGWSPLRRRGSPVAATPASAEWPNDRPIRVMVGFGAGGGTDIVTRIIAQPLSETCCTRRVVVENKPGAGGSLAADLVAKAPPRTATPPPCSRPATPCRRR